MSDSFLEIKLEFISEAHRDIAITFLNDEGPTFEDEVEEQFRHMFPLMDDVEPPEDIKPVGDKSLWAFFNTWADGIFVAQEIIETALDAGAVHFYARFGDVDGNHIFWTCKGKGLVTMYAVESDATADDEIGEMLNELDEKQLLDKVISLYEAGELKSRPHIWY
jgi:hypothetical protein